ncbi:magnesium transporter [Pseudobacteriovorax antillogorgiicola]|uniref:Magnesium transporter MgtE n=1 Tax=Pseudobacteriovorax antillogorgiicola TaxID=1513793 RepID=A0A1Y6B5E3_9BACT|nr:magnesium transporter [Pseudobacteriovorax antillogorgiicola]TCS59211.1 magnesium transporter [Pseudobacteriovorax antillogorgiicola]SME90515.1 magnesium transporter [Pseudobacteriovorax antillogorgiicola]
MHEELTAESLTQYMDSKNFEEIRSAFKSMEIADISEILQDLDLSYTIAFFRMIPKDRRSEVFSYLPFERQREMLEKLPQIVAVNVLNEMEPVDRTQLLEELPEDVRVKKIAMLDPEERNMAWQLLSYPEDSIGRLMSPEFLAIAAKMTVREALADIRWNAEKIRESLLNHIFVIDEKGRLQGHLNLASLVVADPGSKKVSELVDPTPYSISVYEDEGVAVDYFRKYDRPYIPVVDNDGVLVGIVEADDIFDVAEEEATEDIQAFGGQASLEDSYLHTPMTTLFKKRGGWLATIFLMMMFTANVLQAYEDSFALKFIIIFLPLIISSGGNSGSQAASLIIRGLAVKDINLSDWAKVLRREIVMGLGLGIVLGALGYWRVVWIGDHGLGAGIAIGFSLVAVVTFGAVAGSMLPFILKGMKLDPAVSSSPVIASLVDIFGIFILFNIAIIISKYMGF